MILKTYYPEHYLEKDYEFEFLFLKFNRPSKARQKLISSMNRLGFIDPIKVAYSDLDGELIKPKLHILDGQHRVKAAIVAQVPIHANILPKDNYSKKELIELTAAYNNTQKPWTAKDYAVAWADFGKREYAVVLHLHERYSKVTVATLAGLLSGLYRQKPKGFNHGDFKLLAHQETLETLEFAEKLNIYKLNGPISRLLYALQAVKMAADTFKFEEFKAKFDYIELMSLGVDDYYEPMFRYVK